MTQIRPDRIVKISQKRCHRNARRFFVRPFVSRKMTAQPFLYPRSRRRKSRERAVRQSQLQESVKVLAARKLSRQQKFRHHQAVQFILEQHLPIIPLIYPVEALPRRNIGPRQNQYLTFLVKQRDIIILRFGKSILRKNRPRRHDLNHFTLRKARRFGITDLFSDSHLIALTDKTGNICLRRVIGNPAHRCLAHIAAAAGKSQPQFSGSDTCVLKKHFIKIAQTKEENLLRMLFFRSTILLHHRGHFHGSLFSSSVPLIAPPLTMILMKRPFANTENSFQIDIIEDNPNKSKGARL